MGVYTIGLRVGVLSAEKLTRSCLSTKRHRVASLPHAVGFPRLIDRTTLTPVQRAGARQSRGITWAGEPGPLRHDRRAGGGGHPHPARAVM
jgi:hypothetical protein